MARAVGLCYSPRPPPCQPWRHSISSRPKQAISGLQYCKVFLLRLLSSEARLLESFHLHESDLCFLVHLACRDTGNLQHNVAEAMEPPLEPPRQRIDLIKSADRCEQHLNSLKRHATDLKIKHSSGKKHVLLKEIITRSNASIQSLKAWTAAIRKGRQTSDENIRASVNAVFGNIVSRVADARDALDHRLGLSFMASEKSK